MKRLQLSFFFFFFSAFSSIVAQTPVIDSLKLELEKHSENERFEILLGLFRASIGQDYATALLYAGQASAQAEALGDSLAMVKAYNAEGWAKMKIGNALQAIVHFEKALGIAKAKDFKEQVKFLLNNLALANTDLANYDRALDYNFQSLEIRDEEGNPESISIAYNNIGNVYGYLKNYESALEYYDKSRATMEANNIQHDLDRVYNNMGLTYLSMRKYESALTYLTKVSAICETGCSDEVAMAMHYALGQVYLEKRDYVKAEEEFVKSFEKAKDIGSKKYMSQYYYAMASVKAKQGQTDQALARLDESQAILAETKIQEQVLANYQLYVSIYQQAGNYKTASDYQQKYIQLSGDVFSGELIKNLSNIQAQYEERENIRTIAEKNQVLALQEEVISRQRQLSLAIASATVLALGLALVWRRATRQQRKINARLSEAKELIEKQNGMLSRVNERLEAEVAARTMELVETNDNLIKANTEMDHFIYKTSHDIRGPLSTVRGVCYVGLRDIKDPLGLDFIDKIYSTATKLNRILTRLLIINRINQAFLRPEQIDFTMLFKAVLDRERKEVSLEDIDISFDVEAGLAFRSDVDMLSIILKNLIDNAVKFKIERPEKSFVKVSVKKEQGEVTLRVTDNGEGISEMVKDRIFEMFIRASERSDIGGLGLYLSKLATTKLGGTIVLLSGMNGVTEFVARFPPDLSVILTHRGERALRIEKAKQNALKTA